MIVCTIHRITREYFRLPEKNFGQTWLTCFGSLHLDASSWFIRSGCSFVFFLASYFGHVYVTSCGLAAEERLYESSRAVNNG